MLYVHLVGSVKADDFIEDIPVCFQDIQNNPS